jgi:hypothetical protein
MARTSPGIDVTVKPFGPSTEELAAIGERVMALAGVRKALGRVQARLLCVEALEWPGSPPGPYRSCSCGLSTGNGCPNETEQES